MEGIPKTIRQTATVWGATPHEIFEGLMDSKKHTALAGQKTAVSRRVGGSFKVGHDLEGAHLALVKDKRIVQTWRANNWPAGTYSIATFALSKVPGGTRITFRQTGVPREFHLEINEGWRTYYWAPLRARFAARSRRSASRGR